MLSSNETRKATASRISASRACVALLSCTALILVGADAPSWAVPAAPANEPGGTGATALAGAAPPSSSPDIFGELPSGALEQQYHRFHLVDVSQHEAEGLFATAVAAVYDFDRRELLYLSSDPIEQAGIWLALAAGMEHASVPVAASRFRASLDDRVVETRTQRLGDFLLELAEYTRAADGEFIAKRPAMQLERASDPAPAGGLAVAFRGTEYYLYEDFEGDVWSRWSRSDNTGGQYQWGIRSCDAYYSNYSADAARGGSLGAQSSCSAPYPASVVTYMYHQECVTIEPSWLAYLEFRAKGNIGRTGQDQFGVYFTDSTGQRVGWVFWGDWSSQWYEFVFNLRQWYKLGDLGANACNTLYLGLSSDGISSDNGFGVRVDDLYVRVGEDVSSYTCAIVADPITGPAPLTVAFRAVTDMYSPEAYWRFGDGTTSELRDPVHTYNAAGDYIASVVLADRYESWCYASKTIRVTAGSCTYSLTPTSATFPASGGTGTVTLTTQQGCPWSVSSSVAWITITSSTIGAGPATVTYSVAANAGATRTGTLTIAGKTLTVTQSAAPPPCVPPAITRQPQGVTIRSGETATLSVEATGSTPLSFQWYQVLDGSALSPIPGAQSATYTTPPLTRTTSYKVAVNNTCGSLHSSTATVTVESGLEFPFLVPSVAHWPGANATAWHTDLFIVNLSGAPATLDVQYYSAVSSTTGTFQTVLTHGQGVGWSDVLVSLFGLPNSGKDKGTLLVLASKPVVVYSRTYNQTPNGTLGQSFPAITSRRTITSGQIGVLPYLANNAAFRSNVGIVNVGSGHVVVRLRLFGVDGLQVGNALDISCQAGRSFQVDGIFTAAGAGNRDMAYATVEVLTNGGQAWAYGSVVDNATGDPTTVEMVIPE
jgi:hypothetical protein